MTRPTVMNPAEPRSNQTIMLKVLLACSPGAVALFWHFGWGILINVCLCAICALCCEGAALRLRNRPVSLHLRDGSALLTAVLLGLALPPLLPWWIVLTGCVFAIIFGKQLYGGLGNNPFNPAMVGYAALIVCFPEHMSRWIFPSDLLYEGTAHPGLCDALMTVLTGYEGVDGITGATPLDIVRQNSGLMINQLYDSNSVFNRGLWAGVGWEWVNLGFLTGGIFLLYARIFTWHAPIAMLGSLTAMSLFFWDSGSSASLGSPIFHLFSGATMMGAFFIVTDPVSSATSRRGRIIYGVLIGTLVFAIRSWGDYPDALAFAVLLANCVAPTIDRFSMRQPFGRADTSEPNTSKEEC